MTFSLVKLIKLKEKWRSAGTNARDLTVLYSVLTVPVYVSSSDLLLGQQEAQGCLFSSSLSSRQCGQGSVFVTGELSSNLKGGFSSSRGFM